MRPKFQLLFFFFPPQIKTDRFMTYLVRERPPRKKRRRGRRKPDLFLSFLPSSENWVDLQIFKITLSSYSPPSLLAFFVLLALSLSPSIPRNEREVERRAEKISQLLPPTHSLSLLRDRGRKEVPEFHPPPPPPPPPFLRYLDSLSLSRMYWTLLWIFGTECLRERSKRRGEEEERR